MTDGTFRSALDRMLAEALTNAGREDLVGQFRAEYDTTPLIDTEIVVHKSTGHLLVSTHELFDAGLINEEEARAQGWTPPPPPSRRTRLRWRWLAWRERTGRRIGGWVAGVDLSERDDDW